MDYLWADYRFNPAKMENLDSGSLPENAYHELTPGEKYEPVMPDSPAPREVTPYSVAFGIIMATVFSAAAAGGSVK